MTIHEAITRIDSLKFNTYTNHDKIAWLSRADWNVKHHILDKYECTEVDTFEGYTDKTDIHTKLPKKCLNALPRFTAKSRK